MRAASVSVVLALAASLSLFVDSATITAQPWRLRERSTNTGDASGSLTATAGDSGAGGWTLFVEYEGSNCSGSAVMVLADAGCSTNEDAQDCQVADHFGSSSKEDDIPQVNALSQCATDLPTQLNQLFGGQTYIRYDVFDDQNCSQFDTFNAFVADDKCHAQITTDGKTHEAIVLALRSMVDADGAATTRFFNTTDCSGEPMQTLAFNKTQLTNNECVDGFIAFTNANLDEQSDGAESLTVGIVAGLVVTCVALLL